MKKVAIYVRSSKDLHNVSCEAQEEQIQQVVKGNGEKVYKVYSDKALSSTRDYRPAYNEMLATAMSREPPFSAIYCLDTSRFGREEFEANATKYKLRKQCGIDVVFVNMPKTGTPIDSMMESIMTAFDQFHSMTSKQKGVDGQKQNIRNGYRAGGKAPYGYYLKPINQGVVRNGAPVFKTKLEPDPDTAPVIVEYCQRRATGEARHTIIKDFYQRGIPSPSGNSDWHVSTMKSLEDNIDTYMGHTVFNRHNERIKENGKSAGFVGKKKWRPKEEWVITENTHDPLITPEVAAKIREIKEKGLRDAPAHVKRVYALTGLLKCSDCGTNYSGDCGIYKCSSRGQAKRCTNNDISQAKVEGAIFSLIGHMLNFENIQGVIERVKKRFKTGNSEEVKLQENETNLQNKIDKLLLAYERDVITIEELDSRLKPLRDQQEAIRRNITKTAEAKNIFEISEKDIQDVVENLGDELKNADPKTIKRATRALFDEITVHPKKGAPWERMLEIKGTYIPLTGDVMVTPRGLEPLLPA